MVVFLEVQIPHTCWMLHCNTVLHITEFRDPHKLYLLSLKLKFSLYSISKNSLSLPIFTFNYSLPPFPPSQPLDICITDQLISMTTRSVVCSVTRTLVSQCYKHKAKYRLGIIYVPCSRG
jgi:hypothetical protein